MPFYVNDRYCGHLSMEAIVKYIEQGHLIRKGDIVVKA